LKEKLLKDLKDLESLESDAVQLISKSIMPLISNSAYPRDNKRRVLEILNILMEDTKHHERNIRSFIKKIQSDDVR
jgi:phosphoenolpyruvate synthase/pyruvate phosphate dikinase